MANDIRSRKNGFRFVLPFFAVLALLAVIALIPALRPEVSYREKRPLAKFPAFSMEALVSGSYFNDISLWYSDTFPGRELWLDASQELSSLHGYGEISIQGDLPEVEEVPDIPAPTRPAAVPTEPEKVEETEETAEIEEAPETTLNTDPAELEAYISETSIIQIGGSAFHPLGFSQVQSDYYIAALNYLNNKVQALDGVRVISAPAPTAIGIKVDPSYLKMLRSADQGQTLDYIHGSLAEEIVTVDTHSALLKHKDEYLFFHSDHHWTALAAYYSYEAVCEALGMTPRPLEDFTMIDEGEFQGSLYSRVTKPKELEKDIVYAYDPPGNVRMDIWAGGQQWYAGTIIRDYTQKNINSKYVAFLESDQPMVRIINEDLPDAKNCVIVKDSFGNCFVPYFSQNYHTVYAIDYRKYSQTNMASFAEKYDVQDIIFAPNLMATQSTVGVPMLAMQCAYYKK